MTSVSRHRRGLTWRRVRSAKRDAADEQLHRDRMTAAIVLVIMLAVFAAIIGLAALGGTPPDNGTIDPWLMP